LKGILLGIAIDAELNASEVQEVRNWSRDHSALIGLSPLDEIAERLQSMLADGRISSEERDELVWVCGNIDSESDCSDSITRDIQLLQGIMHGILSDGLVSEQEARGLQEWLIERDTLKGTYPYDELHSLLRVVLKDGRIDEDEQQLLISFFDDFIRPSLANQIKKEAQRAQSSSPSKMTLPGVCAISPNVIFSNRVFAFTGASRRCSREEFAVQVAKLGGLFAENVTSKTEYLVIGSAGNPCWAYACYGRKVEKAVAMRKSGTPILLVHENDFWDAVADREAGH